MIGRVNYVVFVASEQSILKFWKKFFAEQFFAGLIFADFQKIAKSAKNSTPRKKRGLQYSSFIFFGIEIFYTSLLTAVGAFVVVNVCIHH